MAKDHLDKEISVSVALTESGVKGSAKSRIIAAIDRLGGNLLELVNVPLETRSERARAKTAGERQLIEAAAAAAVERIKSDPEFAARAFEQHFQRIVRAQGNKDAVLIQAIEDLRREPPSDGESAAGPAELETPFLDRFERYAEDASSEELRQKWGRVLASEIRQPGTFSGKALRLVDELEPKTAMLFERVCASRLTDVLPKCLVGSLKFDEVTDLTTAGLLVEPGLTGQVRQFSNTTDGSGQKLWFFAFGEHGLGLAAETKFVGGGAEAETVTLHKGVAGMPVYVLTSVGAAIATILPDQQARAFPAYIEKLKAFVPSTVAVLEYRKADSGFQLIRTHQGTGSAIAS